MVAEYVGRRRSQRRPLYLVKRELGQGLDAASPAAQGVAPATRLMAGDRPVVCCLHFFLAPPPVLCAIVVWFGGRAWMRPHGILLALHACGREMLRFHHARFFSQTTAVLLAVGAALWLFGLAEIAGRMGALVGAFHAGRHGPVPVCPGAGAAWPVRAGPGGAAGANWLWLVGGAVCQPDMLVAGCITATVLTLAHAAFSLEAGRSPAQPWLAHGLAGWGCWSRG